MSYLVRRLCVEHETPTCNAQLFQPSLSHIVSYYYNSFVYSEMSELTMVAPRIHVRKMLPIILHKFIL